MKAHAKPIKTKSIRKITVDHKAPANNEDEHPAPEEPTNDELEAHELDEEPSDEELSQEDKDHTLAEPTAEELAEVEESLKHENVPEKSNLPAPVRDLLAGYMEQLSHIPLFKPDSERKAAEQLVDLEVNLWQHLLRQPATYEVLADLCVTLERDPQEHIFLLKKRVKRPLKIAGARLSKLDRDIADLAVQMRYIDNDKEFMEQIVSHLRRSHWTPKAKHRDHRTNYSVSYRDLLTIERLRGESLRARNDFVRANLRLVVSVARSFHHLRLPFIDLIQEGNVGLMKAVHRYDHRRGFRFSTYAIWWIRQAIERAIINKGSAVRLPVHVIDTRRQVSRATSKLTQRLGRAPSTAELSKTLRMTQDKVDQVLAGVHQDPVSLDDAISVDDPRNYLDMVRDESTPALDESLIRENTRDRIRELLTLLSPIEKDIIKRRFGMHDGQDQTLDEIGKQYNLSRERVRQIQTQGLIKMRRMCERRKISSR